MSINRLIGGLSLLTLSSTMVQGQDNIVAVDRLGNSYTQEDITMPTGGQQMMMGGGGYCNPCTAGYFNLSFGPGSGMDQNTPTDIARQQVAIRVFEDFSELIIPANDPCTGLPNPGPFVNVQFVNTTSIIGVNWTQTLGFGTSLRNTFIFTNPCNITPSTEEGIVDGEVWRTINGGADSWFNFNVGLWKLAAPGTNMAHGRIALNFSGVPTTLYTGATLPPPLGQADMYTVLAHEVMHMLGIETHIQVGGLGLNGTLYFSRYDLLIKKNGVPWVIDANACSGWNGNLNTGLDLTTGSCGDIVAEGVTANPGLPVFGGNIVHFDGNCANLPFLMHPDNTGPGQSRIPLQEEVNVLCDLGYHINTHHGVSGSGWDDTYATRTSCGQRLAGVDDVFSDCVTKDFYIYKQGPDPLLIDNFLDNDEDEQSGGTPIAFTCMEVIEGGGTINTTSSTAITYQPDPSFVGLAVLRYRPYNSTLNRSGNSALIFIEVWPPDECVDCNILNGGDFEGWRIRNRGGWPHAQYYNPLSGATPDVILWDAGNSQWWNGQSCGPNSYPCAGTSTPVPDSWDGYLSGNDHYAASLHSGTPNTLVGEALILELCRPLLDGMSYKIEFQADAGGTCNKQVQVFALAQRPCNYQQSLVQGAINWAAATACSGGVAPTPIMPSPPTVTGPGWNPYSTTVTYSGYSSNWVGVAMLRMGVSSLTQATFLDDIRIRPLITATPTITPSCNGQNNGAISLDVHYYPGSYSILWNTGATTATLPDLAPGTYTVTITDTELGCATFTESYVVGDAACNEDFTLTKTVSTTHTYSGAPVLYTITVCNNTTASADVQLSDLGLSNFVATSISPAWATFPNAGTFTIPAGGCTTVEVAGHFVAIGTYTNQAHLDPDGIDGNGDELDAYADPVTVLQNCPLVVSGTGDCVTGPVTLCMGVHSLITDVSEIDFDWVYPNFLTPPDQANLLAALVPPPGQSFDPAGCTIGTPAVYDPGNNVVHVHLKYQDPISTAGIHRLFCLPFDLTGTPPAGQNQFLTMVLGSHGQHHSDLYDSNGNEIHPAVGFWTQAANVILTGCPGIQDLDASFTVDLPACGGAVSVHGSLSDPDAIHLWTWGDERTTPINGAQEYTYDYFAPITMNTDWPVIPPIPPAPPGTYTITHTVILDGVASTSTQQVTLVECCPAATVIVDGKHSSTLGSTLNGTVDIRGQFIIDQDFTFSNAQVTTEPGAEIIVQPGRNFNVFNSTIESCQGVMWRGITAQDGTIVQVDNSYLADAESGWTGMNSSILLVSASEFANNRVAIAVPAIPGVDFNSVSIHVENSNFHAEGPLAQPYPGQTSVLGQQGFAALEVYNMTLDFTGQANVLHHLSNGIVARRCNVRVANCAMHDIQPDAAYAYTGNGAGIYARGDHGSFSLKQSGYGIGNLAAASFTKCRWGIYTEYMNVYSTANRMVDMGTAYRVDRSGGRKVHITGNKLDTRYNSIDLRFNDGAVQLLVADNDITFGSLHHENTKGYTAINVQEGNAANPASVIQGNTIHYRHGSLYAANGIALLSASDYQVLGNTLLMDNNAVNRMGIIAAGCRRPLISCNDVHGSATNYGVLQGQSAIRSNMGDHATLYCNTVDGTTNGIYFSGPCYGTDLSGNNIKRHQWGLHLDNNAIIEEQDFKGNLWYNAPVNGGLGAWYENTTNAGAYPFLYEQEYITGGNTEPPSWVPLGWFIPHPGTNYQCGDEQSGYCGHVVREACVGCITGLDGKIAADSLANDPYTEETKWVMEGDLYGKLDNDASLMATDQELADFYATMQGTTTAQFKLINDDYLALFHLDSTVLDYLAQNKAQLEDLMDQLKLAMDSLRDPGLTSAEHMALQATIGGLQQNISSLTALNNQALALADTSRALTAEGVKATNASIATSELIEANEKQVNGIYLSTVAKGIDGFTPEQSTTLFAIANQCPLTGGNAVYRARALYALIDDEQDYDDPVLCLQHGLIYRSMQQVGDHAITVVPNPATDHASLVLDEAWDAPGVFVVYDAMGAEVMRAEVPAYTPHWEFSTAALAPAMYHYRVRGPSGKVSDGKLSIIR